VKLITHRRLVLKLRTNGSMPTFPPMYFWRVQQQPLLDFYCTKWQKYSQNTNIFISYERVDHITVISYERVDHIAVISYERVDHIAVISYERVDHIAVISYERVDHIAVYPLIANKYICVLTVFLPFCNFG